MRTVPGGTGPTVTSQHGAAVYAERGAVVTLAAPAPVADPGGADRVVVGERPGAPPAMQHRNELERLAALVQAGQQVAVVCAVGARGVGKTQLAAAVAAAPCRTGSGRWSPGSPGTPSTASWLLVVVFDILSVVGVSSGNRTPHPFSADASCRRTPGGPGRDGGAIRDAFRKGRAGLIATARSPMARSAPRVRSARQHGRS